MSGAFNNHQVGSAGSILRDALRDSDGASSQREELRTVLEFLGNRCIEYRILHPFPERGFFASTDLDLYVDPMRYREFGHFLRRNGWVSLRSYRFCAIRKFFGKVVAGRKLKLDVSMVYGVFSGTRCFRYLPYVESIVGCDGFHYLDATAGFHLLLKKLLLREGLTDQGIADLNRMIRSSPELKQLPACGKAIDPELLATLERSFREHRKGRFNGVQWLLAHAERLRPSSARVTISLVGLDGAGKSTHCALLRDALRENNMDCKAVYLGYSAFRLRVLRAVSHAMHRFSKGLGRKLLMLLYLALLPLEFGLRRGWGKYDVIVTDRHPTFEPVFGPGSFSWYDRLVSAICPKPDVVVHFTGDSLEIWRRKGETGLDAFRLQERKLEALVKLHARNCRTLRVDSTVSLPDAFLGMWRLIRAFLR